MGLSGISIAQLAILLFIVIAVFGTKKLRTLGDDLGQAVKNFRKAMHDTSSSKEEEHTVSEEKKLPPSQE